MPSNTKMPVCSSSSTQARIPEASRRACATVFKTIAEVELDYISSGEFYHSFPLHIREASDFSKQCKKAFNLLKQPECRPNAIKPPPCHDLRVLRLLEKDLRVALDDDDAEEVSRLLKGRSVKMFKQDCSNFRGWVGDMHFDWLITGQKPVAAEEQEAVEKLRLEWILALPWVADAIEEGVSEEQAVEMAFRPRE